MTHILRKAARRTLWTGFQTVALSWLFHNRKMLLNRIRQVSPTLPDPSLPIGDRFVGTVADREPSSLSG